VNPKVIGDHSQAMVLARLVQAYPIVLVPFGENCRYDLVIHDGDRFIRVQCKTGRLRKGSIRFHACSYTYHHPSNRGSRNYRHDYRNQADVFGVYCPELDAVYLIPVDEVRGMHASLRVETTKNNQVKKIRWARDYELRAGLAQSVEQPPCKWQAVGSNPTPGSPTLW
jgi:PD-(D/E)XK endonuclease